MPTVLDYTVCAALISHFVLGNNFAMLCAFLHLTYRRRQPQQHVKRASGILRYLERSWPVVRRFLGRTGFAIILNILDILYMVFRDGRFYQAFVIANGTPDGTLTELVRIGDWYMTALIVTWLVKTAFADFVMLCRARKLYKSLWVTCSLTAVYFGTLTAAVGTVWSTLQPQASTFDENIELWGVILLAMHASFNGGTTLLILIEKWSVVFRRRESIKYPPVDLSKLALRSFSASNLLYTTLILVLVATYHMGTPFVYFWYDITVTGMTFSFVAHMLFIEDAKTATSNPAQSSLASRVPKPRIVHVPKDRPSDVDLHVEHMGLSDLELGGVKQDTASDGDSSPAKQTHNLRLDWDMEIGSDGV